MPLSIKIGLILSAVIIPLVLYRRRFDPHIQTGFMGGLTASLVIFITTMLTFGLAPWLLDDAYRYLADPTYEATVIDIKTRTAHNDNKGPMYHKVYQFVDNQGHIHTITSSMASGEKPVVGVKGKVKYAADGTFLEVSLAGVLLTLGGLLLVYIFSLFTLYYLFYGMGQNYHAVLNFGIQFTFKILIPLGVSLLLWAFVYNLWLGFTGAKDIPVIAMAIMGFITLMLMLALWGLIPMFWGKQASNNPYLMIGKKK